MSSLALALAAAVTLLLAACGGGANDAEQIRRERRLHAVLPGHQFDLGTIVLAIIGAMLLLIVHRSIYGGRLHA